MNRRRGDLGIHQTLAHFSAFQHLDGYSSLSSACDNIGSVWIASADLPVDVTRCSSELDADCLSVLRHRFSNLHDIGHLDSLTAEALDALLRAHQPDAVLLIGASSRQQVTRASKHTHLFWTFVAALERLWDLSSSLHFVPFYIVENAVTRTNWCSVVSSPLTDAQDGDGGT